MKFGPDPWCKEKQPLAEDLRKKIPRTTLRYWLQKISRWSGPSSPNPKVERLIDDRGWKIIWTPPYCPKFQPIELVFWGAASIVRVNSTTLTIPSDISRPTFALDFMVVKGM
jgi:transposase